MFCSPLSVLEGRLSKSVPYVGGQCSCVFTRCRMSVVIAFCASFFLLPFFPLESVVRSVLAVHVGITCLSLRLP